MVNVTPVERQSSVWNSGAKKILLIHDGGTFTHAPPSGYAPDSVRNPQTIRPTCTCDRARTFVFIPPMWWFSTLGEVRLIVMSCLLMTWLSEVRLDSWAGMLTRPDILRPRPKVRGQDQTRGRGRDRGQRFEAKAENEALD